MIPDVYLLYLDRFMLGVAESVVLPGMLIFLGHWFTSAERSRANAFLILGNPVTVLWMSVVSGYLVHAVGWRGMFIAEGVPAIIWAFLWWRLVQDTPAQAGWLDPRERKTREATFAEEQRVLTAGPRLRRGVPVAAGGRAWRRNISAGALASMGS